MKTHVAPHHDPRRACPTSAASAACSSLDLTGMKKPVLVSGTDGVGTKLKLAFLHGQARHRGHRLRGHVRQRHHLLRRQAPVLPGLHRLRQECARRSIAAIVAGVAEGCVQAGCALIGGETAEMPGFYPEDEYDLAGFSVGVVDKDKIIDRRPTCRPGDVLHRPALLRRALQRLLPGAQGASTWSTRDLQAPVQDLGGTSLGETLLTPTRIYVKPVLRLLEQVRRQGHLPHHRRRLL